MGIRWVLLKDMGLSLDIHQHMCNTIPVNNDEEKGMYFIQKEGVYPHGIFWIGEDELVGITRCRELAATDHDDYHQWVLYDYRPDETYMSFCGWEEGHIELFSTNKSKEEGNYYVCI